MSSSGEANVHLTMTKSRNFQIVVVLNLLVLWGCAADKGEIVYFRGPDGQMRQCGPNYYHPAFLFESGQETLDELRNKCIADYERDGFQRVPATSVVPMDNSGR